MREGRQEVAPKLEEYGLRCQRCDEWTDDIGCMFGNYWICSRCRSFFNNLKAWADRMEEARRGR